MLKQRKKTAVVWVANLNMDSFIYEPKKAQLKECIDAGVEYFENKEEAQAKCDKLNCI